MNKCTCNMKMHWQGINRSATNRQVSDRTWALSLLTTCESSNEIMISKQRTFRLHKSSQSCVGKRFIFPSHITVLSGEIMFDCGRRWVCRAVDIWLPVPILQIGDRQIGWGDLGTGVLGSWEWSLSRGTFYEILRVAIDVEEPIQTCFLRTSSLL